MIEIVVIGGGAAGMMAAITAARQGGQVTLLEPNERLGKKLNITGKGRCNVTNDCDQETLMANIPGNGRFLYSALTRFTPQDTMAFFEGLGVPLKVERGNRVFPVSDRSFDISGALERELRRLHVRWVRDRAREITVQDGHVTGVQGEKQHYPASAVVLATGADPRTLGVAGETELLGRGVAYCAACDGMFYKGKTVVVVGGGNSAAADALLLSRVAKKVILVHRRDTLRATKIYHEPLAQAENVEFRWNSVVSALLSGDRLTGVRLRDTVTGEESVVDCDGVFVSVGRQPATALAVGQLALDGGGYIVAGETTETSIPGVYAVGDVRTKPLRQVVTAVADGAVAVHMAEKYIAENR